MRTASSRSRTLGARRHALAPCAEGDRWHGAGRARKWDVLDGASVFGSEPVAQSRIGGDASAHYRAGDREQRRPCRFRPRTGNARRPNRASRQDRVDICQGCPGRLRTGFLRRYVSVRAYSDAFATMGVARERPAAAVVNGRSSVRLVAAITSDLANLFQLPLQDGVVISHRLWQDEFGGRTDIRGERVRIDDTPYRIGGVAPEWLDAIYAGSSVDIWAPWSPPSDAAERRGQTLWALGRLHDGVSASQAQALVNTGRETGHLIAVLPYTGLAPEGSAGMSRMRAILPIVALAVFFIACVNVATFLLDPRPAHANRACAWRLGPAAAKSRDNCWPTQWSSPSPAHCSAFCSRSGRRASSRRYSSIGTRNSWCSGPISSAQSPRRWLVRRP